MWQELCKMRAEYLDKYNIKAQGYPSRLVETLLYEIARLEGITVKKQDFLDVLNEKNTPERITEWDIYRIKDLESAFLYLVRCSKQQKKFSSEFINRKIKLRYEGITEDIVTDEKWFQTVIEQILSNALKYTRQGSISIYYKDNKLYIEDTGIGIAPEDLPRIFENGYTGYNGRKDKRASGIGLYLVKRICTNLGIGIKIESELNRGTTVILDISREKPEFE